MSVHKRARPTNGRREWKGYGRFVLTSVTRMHNHEDPYRRVLLIGRLVYTELVRDRFPAMTTRDDAKGTS